MGAFFLLKKEEFILSDAKALEAERHVISRLCALGKRLLSPDKIHNRT